MSQKYPILKNPFKKGWLYLVKVFDHFTRRDADFEHLFIEFIGFFLEEIDHYYKFVAYYYNEYTTEELFYSNEIRFIVKYALFDWTPLDAKLNCKELDERNFEERKVG